MRSRDRTAKHHPKTNMKLNILDNLEAALRKLTKPAMALIALTAFFPAIMPTPAEAQITNLGLGLTVAQSGTYGLAPSVQVPASQASNGCPALAYIPSGSNVVFPLTNAFPANTTNWFLGTNGMGTNAAVPQYLMLNLTHWEEAVLNVAYQVLTNTGAGCASTNWLFLAPSPDGINLDTNHLLSLSFVAYTNNTTAGSSGGLFTTNYARTILGSYGYYGVVGVGNQGTNTQTNWQFIPTVKSKTRG